MILLTCLIALWAPPDAIIQALAKEEAARAVFEREAAGARAADQAVRASERAQEAAEAEVANIADARLLAEGSRDALVEERQSLRTTLIEARGARPQFTANASDKARARAAAKAAVDRAATAHAQAIQQRKAAAAALTGDPGRIAALERAFEAEADAREALRTAHDGWLLADAEAEAADATLLMNGAMADRAQSGLTRVDGLIAQAQAAVDRLAAEHAAARARLTSADEENGIALKDQMEADASAQQAEDVWAKASEARDEALQAAAEAVGP